MNVVDEYNVGVFHSFLWHAREHAPFVRWFVINHDDESDPHTLCCLMHLTYTGLILFLESCSLTDNYYLGMICPVQEAMRRKLPPLLFVASIDDVEHTRYKMKLRSVHCNYQFFQIGGHIPPSSQVVGVPAKL